MAHKCKYRCKSCGYEADIYLGNGFMGQHIVTVSCPDCRTLQPLVVGGIIGDAAPSFSTEAGRFCLNCGSMNIRRWDGKTCPKCGGEMVETGEVEFWT